MSLQFARLMAAGGAPPAGNNIVSDNLADNPAAPLVSRTGVPNPGSDIGAQWALHPGGNAAPAQMTASAVSAPGGFLDTAAGSGAWYSQAGPTDSIVIETQLIENGVSTTTGHGVVFCVDPALGGWQDWYIILNGGAGGGGMRISQQNGSAVVDQIASLQKQGVDGGICRVELDYSTWVVKFWTDYIANPQESGIYYGTDTLTAKAGRSVGIHEAGGVQDVKRFSRYQYGQGF